MGVSSKFLKQFFSKPGTTGAVFPSSRWLAKEMVRGLDLGRARAVLEYGPGTGAFTKCILEQTGPETRFIAIEVNSELARIFCDRHPQVTLVQDSVANVRRICDQAGIGEVDVIVSGLPWAAFERALQQELLDAMMLVLRPGGMFVTFAYVHGVVLPAGQRFARLLPHYFKEVSKSRIVGRNLPPAFVYRCKK